MTRLKKPLTEVKHYPTSERRAPHFIGLLNRSEKPFHALDKALLYGAYIDPLKWQGEDALAIQKVLEDLTTQYKDLNTEGLYGINFKEIGDLIASAQFIALRRESYQGLLTIDDICKALDLAKEEPLKNPWLSYLRLENIYQIEEIVTQIKRYAIERYSMDLLQAMNHITIDGAAHGIGRYLQNVTKVIREEKFDSATAENSAMALINQIENLDISDIEVHRKDLMDRLVNAGNDPVAPTDSPQRLNYIANNYFPDLVSKYFISEVKVRRKEIESRKQELIDGINWMKENATYHSPKTDPPEGYGEDFTDKQVNERVYSTLTEMRNMGYNWMFLPYFLQRTDIDILLD